MWNPDIYRSSAADPSDSLRPSAHHSIYRSSVSPLIAGKNIVCVGKTLSSMRSLIESLQLLGAVDVLVVTFDADETISPDDAKNIKLFQVLLPAPESSMDALRAEEEFKLNPSHELLDVLQRFDPDRLAVVIGQFVNTASHLDGRPFLAYRRPEWLALEDKTVVDSFWDRVGIERAPFAIAAVEAEELRNATKQLDSGTGVVWSGDSRDGFNGGAEYVHAVRNEVEFASALRFFATRCDQVRLMPFLEGIPCSIHGVVFPNYVAAVRPIEMVVLRRSAPRAGEGLFNYRGCASFFDPSNIIRAQMIDVAKRVGEQLQNEVSFRGCFTVDGVATAKGFLPTELNPRLGAGLSQVFASIPEIPFNLLLDALVAGYELGLDPVQFERDLRTYADNHRVGGTWGGASSEVVKTDSAPLVFDAGSWRWAVLGETPDGLVSSGTRSGAGYARLKFEPATMPVGQSVGPAAVAFWSFADSELGADVGPLASAPDC